MSEKPIGSTWLKQHYQLSNIKLSHESYLGTRSKVEILQDGSILETYQKAQYTLKTESSLSHFEFALKYDDVQMSFYQAVLKCIPKTDIVEYIKTIPSSKYSRKIGFWYEFLTGEHLPIEDRPSINYVDLIDSKRYFTGAIVKNSRWRINNNLLGDVGFCPTIKKTDTISKALERDFSETLRELTKNYSPEILTRANNYLYKKETRSSYQIEKEEPTPERLERFVSLLGNAGKIDIKGMLSEESLVQLQNQIVDQRFSAKGFRNFQNYIGQTAWNYDEIIHYVCPPPEFLSDLMKDLSNTAIRMEGVNPIVRATVIAFGFVFIHPFEDGNGRIHRFLIHDFLSRDNFLPTGMIIPVSAHMLNNLKQYDDSLEAYSKPIMQIIKYTKDKKQKLIVLNASEVEGYYRFPDLTAQTEYLCKVIETAISQDLPNELNFLQNYDEAKELMKQRIDMPDMLIDSFIRFTHQNNGVFPKRRRNTFLMLKDDEIEALQSIFKDVFASGR
ncbi:MAG: Fic family protein [Bacteroidales bacterium]|nr:Fic family protein [Bacteroidales bacterium]